MKRVNAIFNLLEGEDDREKTLETVTKNIKFEGANLWILACAIIVASIGLNVNSTAVIIGAMLMSPLMGPIVGAGFALGIYDFSLLKKSLMNLFIATLVSLVVSTLYFLISPFKDVQSELLSRTAPNIYDILIAFFGGLAGVIAVTRIEKGNPIPGVAIATALMPPLCTAGYGLATGQWTFFLGAFYLYCINCTFIGIATFLIIKYLKYPAKKQVDQRHQKTVRIFITLLIVIMMVPSAYLAYSLYNEQQFKKNTEKFISDEFTSKGYIVIYKKTDAKSSKKKIELALLSKRFSDDELKKLDSKLNKNPYLKGTALIIKQDSTDRYNALKGDILNEIKSSENELNTKQVKIAQLEKEISKTKFNIQLAKETRILFPQVKSLSVTEGNLVTAKDSLVPITAVLYNSEAPLTNAEKDRLKIWLLERLATKNIELFRQQE